MVNAERLVDEFLELVRIDSVSGQEREVADALKKKLTSLGLDVYEDDAGAKTGTATGNIIAKLPGDGSLPVIMFSAHMDTVKPGEGVRPKIKDGIVYSAGDTILGSDDKAGIVVILEALRSIIEQEINHGGIEIVFTIKEEVGLLGAKNIDRDRLKATMGFVLDSDGDPGAIVIRGPSQDRIDAVISGKAAHAGINPEDGVDALRVAALAINKMKLGRIDKETTANIGLVSGGNAVNIVPAKVLLQGEARSLDDAKRKLQTERMCQAYRKAALEMGATVDLDVETLYPCIDLSSSADIVKITEEAAHKSGLASSLQATGGGSDANIFNGMGIPTVNLGIGMKKVHTTEEYIEIAHMVKMVVFLVEIVNSAYGHGQHDQS